MRRSFVFLSQLLLAAALALPAMSQETSPTAVPCTDQDKATMETCKAACDAALPQCQETEKAPITLDELRAKLAEKCDCTKAKNFGQYESCVKRLMGALREFNMIDKATRLAIGEDNKKCRAEIKKGKKEKK